MAIIIEGEYAKNEWTTEAWGDYLIEYASYHTFTITIIMKLFVIDYDYMM